MTARWLIGVSTLFVSGCERLIATLPAEPQSEPVIVYPARLVREHPLYPQVETLSARIAALEAAPDLGSVRALLSHPLAHELFPPPKPQSPTLGSLTAWQADADAALAARVQEAEQELGLWPQPSFAKMQMRVQQQVADAVRDAENEASVMRLRAEIRAIERRQDELEQLRRLAQSRNAVEAGRAVARQAALWREIAGEVESARREAETRLRELRQAAEAEATRALSAAIERLDSEREAYRRDLETAGQSIREQQPISVRRALRATEPAGNARSVAEAPDVAALEALVEQVEAAQKKARERRLNRLVEVRGCLLKQIALSTESAVRAVALRNGLDVRIGPSPNQALRDATEEFRPLIKDYWAGRPALANRT